MNGCNYDITKCDKKVYATTTRFRPTKFGGICLRCGKKTHQYYPVFQRNKTQRKFSLSDRLILRNKLKLCGYCWLAYINSKDWKERIEVVLTTTKNEG
jgi:hypothetical protein